MSAVAENNATPTFVYWGLAARAQESMLMLDAAKIDYVWDKDTANKWKSETESPKENMPFGQLPVLRHNGMQIAQSGTITRYCAALSSLLSDKIEEQVLSDMLHEHCNDIFTCFAKAKYAGDDFAQKVAWERVKGKDLPEKLKWLVKLLGDKTFFSGDKVQAGDISVFSILNIAFKAGLDNCLDDFPTLLSHYNAVSRIGNIPKYIEAEHPAYIVVPK
jgi:glutathione S-transferase